MVQGARASASALCPGKGVHGGASQNHRTAWGGAVRAGPSGAIEGPGWDRLCHGPAESA